MAQEQSLPDQLDRRLGQSLLAHLVDAIRSVCVDRFRQLDATDHASNIMANSLAVVARNYTAKVA